MLKAGSKMLECAVSNLQGNDCWMHGNMLECHSAAIVGRAANAPCWQQAAQELSLNIILRATSATADKQPWYQQASHNSCLRADSLLSEDSMRAEYNQ